MMALTNEQKHCHNIINNQLKPLALDNNTSGQNPWFVIIFKKTYESSDFAKRTLLINRIVMCDYFNESKF